MSPSSDLSLSSPTTAYSCAEQPEDVVSAMVQHQVTYRKQFVRFADEVLIYQIPRMPPLPSCQSSACATLWWTDEDYRYFRERDRRTVEFHEILSIRRSQLESAAATEWRCTGSSSSMSSRFSTDFVDTDDDDDDKSDNLCMRGLEGRTPYALVRRREQRWESLHTVMAEQDFQSQESYPDPVFLAECYADTTHLSAQEALHRAYCDEQYVKRYIRRSCHFSGGSHRLRLRRRVISS